MEEIHQLREENKRLKELIINSERRIEENIDWIQQKCEHKEVVKRDKMFMGIPKYKNIICVNCHKTLGTVKKKI